MTGTAAVQSLNTRRDPEKATWPLDEPVNEPIGTQHPIAYDRDRYLIADTALSRPYRSFSPLVSEVGQNEILFVTVWVPEEFNAVPRTSSQSPHWGFGTQTSSQILSVVAIASFNIAAEHEIDPDPLDIRLQIDEIAKLEQGWADGMQPARQWGAGYGERPDAEGLEWLARQFASHYAPGLPRPYLYPIPDGGVQAEWSLGPNEASLEIDLTARTAEWHCLDVRTGRSSEHALDLDEERAWKWLGIGLRQLGIQD